MCAFVLPKATKRQFGSGSKKGQQMYHHKETRKYEKQKVRTAANKARHIAKAKLLKQQADERKAARGVQTK